MNHLEFIKDILSKNDFGYIEITNENTIQSIYDLYSNSNSDLNLIEKTINNTDDSVYYLYVGHYFNMKTEVDLMKQYYLKAIHLKNADAMNNLGFHYKKLGEFDLMKYYYCKAIEYKNSNAMNNLAFYYKETSEFTLMKEYLFMAIQQNNSYAMNNLGCFYKETREYPLMKKYYLMAIRHKNPNPRAMFNLGLYYQEMRQNTFMKHYYLMAIRLKHVGAMFNLANYYRENEEFDLMEKYYSMTIRENPTHSESIQNLLAFYKEKKQYDDFISLIHNNLKYINKETKEIYKNFIQFYRVRLQTSKKKEQCDVCLEIKDLIYFDCICHYFCVSCYLRLEECALCKVPKNPYFKNII